MPLLEPDWHFQKVADIPIDLIKQLDIKLIFIDIDNTIAPRDSDDFVPSAVAWIESVKKLGVTFAFLSNGRPRRVVRACKMLDIRNIYPGLKPLPFSYWLGMLRFRAKPSRTLMIGDQLPTDILGAHLAGIKAILVDPVNIDTDVKWTKFTRKLFKARRNK
ncbi:MAG: YqeG family HAD IIIA-type phosphatase [Caldiserica bacterium]|nr:YqeG family HAD IIIA-type phosphatase [Caldisericota bacterium]